MACKRCEISTSIKDSGVDIFFVTETWLSAQGDKAKTVELAPSGFDVKSFPRQSRSRGGGIATVSKSTLGSNITFKTNFDFTHKSFEVVQASTTLQHNTLHCLCCCCCCCRPHSPNVLPAESSTRIMWQPTVSPPRWQGKAPLCRDSSRGPG